MANFMLVLLFELFWLQNLWTVTWLSISVFFVNMQNLKAKNRERILFLRFAICKKREKRLNNPFNYFANAIFMNGILAFLLTLPKASSENDFNVKLQVKVKMFLFFPTLFNSHPSCQEASIL